MIWIGIDPGAKGGFAEIIQDPQGQYVNVFAWDEAAFVKEMRDIGLRLKNPEGCVIAAVEKVGAMPHQGVVSTFSFGTNYGFILGVLRGLNIPFQTVPPREWKKMFGLNSDKARSIEVCRRLYPDVDLKRTDRCRVDSDGKAESILIGTYAMRKWG